MKRIAKEPNGTEAIKGFSPGRSNQQVLDLLILSLKFSSAINPALWWVNTKEGQEFWSNYCHSKGDPSAQKKRILSMIEEVSIPLKPFKKENWI